jgi:hypothetical protein
MDINEKLDQVFLNTRLDFDHAMQASRDIHALSDSYLQAIETAIDELGDSAFDESGQMKADSDFANSLIGLQEVGVKATMSDVRKQACIKLG